MGMNLHFLDHPTINLGGHRLSPPSTAVHRQVFYQKRHPVRLLLDDFTGGLPGTVSRLRLDLDQHRLRARLRGLERRRELERVPRHHAIVAGYVGPGRMLWSGEYL